MRKAYLVLVGAAACLVVASNARADLHLAIAPGTDALVGVACLPEASATALPATDLGRPSYGGEVSFAGLGAADLLNGDPFGPVVPAPASSAVLSTHGEIRELPGLPGSASLFLSAVLSMGGWHLVRSARQLHWGALPEWYHTGGPLQIGHTVPFDLNLSASPPCCFEQPAGERPYLYRVRRELRPRCDAQQFLVILAAPRGPPVDF